MNVTVPTTAAELTAAAEAHHATCLALEALEDPSQEVLRIARVKAWRYGNIVTELSNLATLVAEEERVAAAEAAAKAKASEGVRHEVLVDREIAETYKHYFTLHEGLVGRIKTILKRVAGTSRAWHKFDSVEGVGQLLAMDAATRRPLHPTDAEALRTRAVAAAEAEAAYLEKARMYDGWTRFFLVPGGHIHSSMYCSTCNRGGSMTNFGWLPELSGLGEAAAVAEHGPILCTVCFPSAPVEWTVGNKKDEDICPGSGTRDYEEQGRRVGFYSGNGGFCQHCGEWAGQASRNNAAMRKHKAK